MSSNASHSPHSSQSGHKAPSGVRVVLAGATGLTGSHCLRLLRQDPGISQLLLPGRHLQGEWQQDARLLPLAADLSSPQQLQQLDLRADVALCTLGTTLRKAGSRSQFRVVDHDYVVNFARAVQAQGCRYLGVISAAGSHPRSPMFYSRVKGQMEQSLERLGFEGLWLLRPSLLLGQRQEARLLEDISQRLAPAVGGLLPARYRPIEAAQLARVMQQLVHKRPSGVLRLEGRQLLEPIG